MPLQRPLKSYRKLEWLADHLCNDFLCATTKISSTLRVVEMVADVAAIVCDLMSACRPVSWKPFANGLEEFKFTETNDSDGSRKESIQSLRSGRKVQAMKNGWIDWFLGLCRFLDSVLVLSSSSTLYYGFTHIILNYFLPSAAHEVFSLLAGCKFSCFGLGLLPSLARPISGVLVSLSAFPTYSNFVEIYLANFCHVSLFEPKTQPLK